MPDPQRQQQLDAASGTSASLTKGVIRRRCREIDQIAMHQHGCADAGSVALHGHNQWLARLADSFDEAMSRAVDCVLSMRLTREIREIVTGR
jgi:hypothetical protein